MRERVRRFAFKFREPIERPGVQVSEEVGVTWKCE